MPTEILTPVKSIRAHCIECCGGSKKDVASCQILECPLWPYRNGTRPDDTTKKAYLAGCFEETTEE